MTDDHISAGLTAFTKRPESYDDLLHAIATERSRAYAQSKGLTGIDDIIVESGRKTAKAWRNEFPAIADVLPDGDKDAHSRSSSTRIKTSKIYSGQNDRVDRQSPRIDTTRIVIGAAEDLGRQLTAPLNPDEGDPVKSFMTLSKQAKAIITGTAQATVATAIAAARARSQNDTAPDNSGKTVNMVLFHRGRDHQLSSNAYPLVADNYNFQKELHTIFKPKKPFVDLAGSGHSIGAASLMKAYVEADIPSEKMAASLHSVIQNLEALKAQKVGENDYLVMLTTRPPGDPELAKAALDQFQKRDASHLYRAESTRQNTTVAKRDSSACERE